MKNSTTPLRSGNPPRNFRHRAKNGKTNDGPRPRLGWQQDLPGQKNREHALVSIKWIQFQMKFVPSESRVEDGRKRHHQTGQLRRQVTSCHLKIEKSRIYPTYLVVKDRLSMFVCTSTFEFNYRQTSTITIWFVQPLLCDLLWCFL